MGKWKALGPFVKAMLLTWARLEDSPKNTLWEMLPSGSRPLTPRLEDTSSQTTLLFLSDQHVISFSDWEEEPVANTDHNLSDWSLPLSWEGGFKKCISIGSQVRSHVCVLKWPKLPWCSSRFLFSSLDNRTRQWCSQHDSLLSSCVVLLVTLNSLWSLAPPATDTL